MKIAILGGTFDPVHNGHLRAAQAVAEAFAIDEVHFVPAFAPPHKPASGITSAFHRFAMVALAIGPISRFRISSIESDTLTSRFSVDTLESMHNKYPGASFLFIAGTDMYNDIDATPRGPSFGPHPDKKSVKWDVYIVCAGSAVTGVVGVVEGLIRT